MRRVFTLLLVALITLSLPAFAAKKNKKDEVDHVALAALLISDGYYDRAEATLAQVNESDEKLDKVRFYTLRGLVHLKKQRHAPAASDFNKAIKAGQTDLSIYIYLAQAHYALKEYEKTVIALNSAGALAEEKPNLFSIKAQCYWMLKDHNAAWNVLDSGMAKFPEYGVFYRQKFFYLVDLGLYQDAAFYGAKYLEIGKPKVEDYLAIGSAFRKNHEFDKALIFLESARLQKPGEVKILIELAHVYMDMDKGAIAASLFEEASQYENTFSKEASELYRRAKRMYRALYLNQQIVDQKEKFKQRMAIFLEFGDFESASAMGPSMSRVGLLENEDLRYALAYSLFQIGKFDACEEHLKILSRPDLFQKSAELRKSIAECRAEPLTCPQM